MNEEEYTTYSTLIVLELLTSSLKYLTDFSAEFPSCAAAAKSFSKAYDTASQEVILTHYKSNQSDVDGFTKKFIENNSSELNWANFLEKYKTYQASGQLFKIDKTSKAYSEFVSRMQTERWVFSHMSVAVDGDKYVLFFA